MSDPSVSAPVPSVSIVVPVKNEAGNIGPLVDEIAAALADVSFEVVCVDDGSRDATDGELTALQADRPWLRHLKHVVSCGQSAALRTGVIHARAPIIATIDGDGQNDPKYLPGLFSALEQGGRRVGLAAGQRIDRQATGFKKLQSRIANEVRMMVLDDETRDTGCGLKALRREIYLALPYFDGMHRFLPALVQRDGYDIVHVDVVDRPRQHGTSNYGMWDRLWASLLDLAGVWWLTKRRKHIPAVSEVKPDAR
jgi:glycosyltransferase involved in cell wall biosynthesis